MKTPTPLAVLLTALLSVSALYAYEAGGSAYTKRAETNLLTEPKPLAATAAKLPFGRMVKIEEIAGNWLQVSDGQTTGWVFAGNLSATKPDEGKGMDALPMLASQTTATAAARPLAPAAIEYASQKNLSSAQGDLEWLLTECHALTPEEVDAFMQENKRGEYK
jgi:hypothetical protein